MLIRITGGSSGIAEYLESGQKADREFLREQLDERVILDGDLELTDLIIKGMDKEGEKYLHITLAFKEDTLDRQVLQAVLADFKAFAMSAYDEDEYNFYAEAHLPKLKSYINRKTGDVVERKPHIHVVIPEQNLLTGKNLNPFGLVEQQIRYLEAFQEHTNAKYGLASPRDNRRTEFTGESEMISRYKGDLFQGAAKELKERILAELLERKTTDYEEFKSLLSKHGTVRTRNKGTPSEYQNVKPEGQAKGTNLKDYVFSRAFIEKPEAEKQSHLAEQGRIHYESQGQPRQAEPPWEEALQEWHDVRAKEIKHINSGNRKLYAAYRSSSPEEKRAILDGRAQAFQRKHRTRTTHDRHHTEPAPGGPRPGPSPRDSRRTLAHIADNLRAAGRTIQSTGRLVGDLEQARRNLADRRTRRAVEALGRRLGGDQGQARPVALQPPGPRDRRAADNVVGQLAADHREHQAEAKAEALAEFAHIKRTLDARRLLAHLSRTHGVIPDKYEVTQGKDGDDRIKAGTRHLNVSDFLTQEMSLSFTEAAPILRLVYAEQQRQEPAKAKPPPSRELWQAFRDAQPDIAKQYADELDRQRRSESQRRMAIRNDYQDACLAILADRKRQAAERHAAFSLASMERATKDMALNKAILEERQRLKDKHRQPYPMRYIDFLADCANRGMEAALAELRRQSPAGPQASGGGNFIEGFNPGNGQGGESHLEHSLAYTVDLGGNVAYYADHTKQRLLVIDSAQRVTVAAAEDGLAVEIGLRLALQKFGPALKVEGGDGFKRQIIEAALNADLRVEFDDRSMNEALARRRAERDAQQGHGNASQTEAPSRPHMPAIGEAQATEVGQEAGRQEQPGDENGDELGNDDGPKFWG